MKKILFLSLFLVFFAAHAWAASCGSPDLFISVAPTKTFVTSTFDINLTLSQDPAVNTTCPCMFGEDCGLHWEYNAGGTWAEIPFVPTNDLNCSTQVCDTNGVKPSEDRPVTRKISCNGMNTYQVRGKHPLSGTATAPVTVYCYQASACIAPSSGNFTLNQTCTYTNVPLFIDGNFNIQSSGRSIHNGSDINFFSSSIHYVNIQNGGRLDLNKSALYKGLTQTMHDYGPGGIILLILFAVPILFRKYWFSEATA